MTTYEGNRKLDRARSNSRAIWGKCPPGILETPNCHDNYRHDVRNQLALENERLCHIGLPKRHVSDYSTVKTELTMRAGYVLKLSRRNSIFP